MEQLNWIEHDFTCMLVHHSADRTLWHIAMVMHMYHSTSGWASICVITYVLSARHDYDSTCLSCGTSFIAGDQTSQISRCNVHCMMLFRMCSATIYHLFQLARFSTYTQQWADPGGVPWIEPPPPLFLMVFTWIIYGLAWLSTVSSSWNKTVSNLTI